MANQRRLRLQRFGITGARYDELKALCRQYDEWTKSIRRLSMAQAKNEMQLRILESCKERKVAFDEALRMTVDGECGISEPLFENLVHNKPYEHLNVPMNKKTFYEFRTAFFVNFNQLI